MWCIRRLYPCRGFHSLPEPLLKSGGGGRSPGACGYYRRAPSATLSPASSKFSCIRLPFSVRPAFYQSELQLGIPDKLHTLAGNLSPHHASANSQKKLDLSLILRSAHMKVLLGTYKSNNYTTLSFTFTSISL